MSDDLNQRLEQLERRLAELEKHIGVAKPASVEQPPVVDKISMTGTLRRLNEMKDQKDQEYHRPAGQQRSVEANVTPAILMDAEPLANQSAQMPSPSIEPETVSSPPIPERVVVEQVSRKPNNLEQLFGLKLAGWIGAVVLVIGSALGVKYVYDQGWLGVVPDSVTLGLLYLVGIAVLGIGEWVHRKVSALASTGIFGAGVALLFVVSYAGYGYYELYSQGPAFALMAASCAIGAIIAYRVGMVSIAVLSLIGANLAPVIVRPEPTSQWNLPIYLLALQLVALFLAYIHNTSGWWVLRVVSLLSIGLWSSQWLVLGNNTHGSVYGISICVYALLYHIEVVLSSSRLKDQKLRPTYAGFSFAVTAMLGAGLYRWSSDLSPTTCGLIFLGLAVITLMAAALLRRTNRPMAISYIAQSMTLFVATVPIVFSGPWVLLAWVCQALGYAALGVWVKSVPIRRGSAVVWLLTLPFLGHHIANDSPAFFEPVFSWFAGVSPVWFVLLMGTGIAGWIVGHLIRESRTNDLVLRDGLSKDVATVAALVMGVGCLYQLDSPYSSLALVVMAWCLIGLDRLISWRLHLLVATALIGLACVRWTVFDVLPRLGNGTAGSAFLNTTTMVGVAVLGSLYTLVRFGWQRVLNKATQAPDDGKASFIALVLVITLATVSMSVELVLLLREVSTVWPKIQAAAMALSVLWTAALMAIWMCRRILVGQASRAAITTAIGFSLALVMAKFVTVDVLVFSGLMRGPTLPIMNLQSLSAIVLVGCVLWVARKSSRRDVRDGLELIAAIIVLIVGTKEVGRQILDNKYQFSLSAFYSVYSLVLIVCGFAWRSKVLRMAGLALLGLTLCKIVFIDLSDAGTGWRILSFIGLGSILLGTSVVYGKLSPVLLGENKDPAADHPGHSNSESS